MAHPSKALFLEQATYRRRRTVDAARLLPILGIVLIFVPLFWGLGDETTKTSSAIMYLFGTWVALVGLAVLVAWRLRVANRTVQADELERD